MTEDFAKLISPYFYRDGKTTVDWKCWETLVQISESIKWPCKFDQCDARCCRYCHRDHGYLYVIKKENLNIYLDNWDDENGFRSPNGCKLPKKLRSKTCLSYFCSSNTRDMSIYDIVILGCLQEIRIIKQLIPKITELIQFFSYLKSIPGTSQITLETNSCLDIQKTMNMYIKRFLKETKCT